MIPRRYRLPSPPQLNWARVTGHRRSRHWRRRLLVGGSCWVLDNCEHLIDVCARLADALLRGCPDVTLLATSREALAIQGEVVWPVAALTVAEAGLLPSSDPGPRPAEVLASEAGRLFVERASAVRPDFSVTVDNAAALAGLCRQLDGIPLAIELAAARVNVFEVRTIVSRLADHFVLLRSGNRLAPSRHQTLQALMRWSYDLLPRSSGGSSRDWRCSRGGGTSTR